MQNKLTNSLLAIIAGCICALSFSGCENMRRGWNNEPSPQQVSDHNAVVNAVNDELAMVKIGMTETRVIGLLGYPTLNNVSRTAAGKSEQWIYSGESLINHTGTRYWSLGVGLIEEYKNFQVFLYFENGILTRTQGF